MSTIHSKLSHKHKQENASKHNNSKKNSMSTSSIVPGKQKSGSDKYNHPLYMIDEKDGYGWLTNNTVSNNISDHRLTGNLLDPADTSDRFDIQRVVNKNVSTKGPCKRQAAFDEVCNNNRPTAEKYARESGEEVNGFYNEYITCESLVKMYQATGDTKYIDQACKLDDSYIANGRDMGHDGYKTWQTDKAFKDSQGHEDHDPNHHYINHEHYECRCADAVSTLCNQIMSDPNLREKYGDKAKAYKKFIEKDVWEKWSNFEGRCAMISPDITPGDEHFVARIGKIALDMYNCTGETKYKKYLDKQVPRLRDNIRINHGRIIGDPSHSADTADFLAACFNSPLTRNYFTQNDINNAVAECKERKYLAGWVALAQFDKTGELYREYESRSKGKTYDIRSRENVIANLAAMDGEVCYQP